MKKKIIIISTLSGLVITAYFVGEYTYKNTPYYVQLKTQEYPRWIKTVTLVTESVQKRINKLTSQASSCSGLENLKKETEQKIKATKDYFCQLNCGTTPNLIAISVYYRKQQVILTQQLKTLFADFYKKARQSIKFCKTNPREESKS